MSVRETLSTARHLTPRRFEVSRVTTNDGSGGYSAHVTSRSSATSTRALSGAPAHETEEVVVALANGGLRSIIGSSPWRTNAKTVVSIDV